MSAQERVTAVEPSMAARRREVGQEVQRLLMKARAHLGETEAVVRELTEARPLMGNGIATRVGDMHATLRRLDDEIEALMKDGQAHFDPRPEGTDG